VTLVKTDVSREHVASIIKEKRSSGLKESAFLRSVLRLLVTADAVPSSPLLVTLMMEAIHSSETSVLTRATWRHIQEDGILHSHCF
jgi:hypothetical protein